jgi:hypothetical protein
MSQIPTKAKNLKIIDYKGTCYCTFDGEKMWKIENWVVKLLMLCDGSRSFDQIAEEIVKISKFPLDDVKIGLKPVLDDLEQSGFIVYK